MVLSNSGISKLENFKLGTKNSITTQVIGDLDISNLFTMATSWSEAI